MNEYICGMRFILKYYISNGEEEYANSHNWGHVDQLGGETMPTQIIVYRLGAKSRRRSIEEQCLASRDLYGIATAHAA